jgi:hypothetical protein
MTKIAKGLLIAGLAAAVMIPVGASADRFQKSEDTNPLRLVGYVANAVGTAAEWIVFRPIHWVVSQPNLDIVFGHAARVKDEPGHWEWKHGDYRPSIAKEREAKAAAKPAAKRAEKPKAEKKADKAEKAPK